MEGVSKYAPGFKGECVTVDNLCLLVSDITFRVNTFGVRGSWIGVTDLA